ncbi:hypothetical protein [Allorhizobium terrae]|uniref:Glycosyltransferase family 1 protein n=1 Tax=Allorhizobium terrae TaxID=1848972 RepID=A0A4S3ZVV9_9HYPH|nr:hypothetical protein [Allorhizobium terrae]THF49753.1 hypothetical protein E6C51_12520 [Allorhizobium terrae]
MKSAIKNWLYHALPKPCARREISLISAPVKRVLVIREGPNPSFTYYLEARLKTLEVPFDVIENTGTVAEIDPATTFVIICRYIRLSKFFWLWRHRAEFPGVALFIDDDIAATVVEGHSGLGYKIYLIGLGLIPLIYLNRVLTGVWASTTVLAESLRANAILPPFPAPDVYVQDTEGGSNSDGTCRMAFHATGAHDAEHAFLMPIVKTALHMLPNLHFKVVAEERLAKIWRHELRDFSGRVQTISPLPWPDYLKNASHLQTDILLVPLLNGRVNNARADTKRIDASRLAAAAIFSRCKTYERCFTEKEIMVDNDVQSWLDAIKCLVLNKDRRQEARYATSASVIEMLRQASPQLPGLGDFCSKRDDQ